MNRQELAERLAYQVRIQPGFRWLQPHHVLLFAYRPKWFDRRPEETSTRSWWGPAYTHRLIRKRGPAGLRQSRRPSAGDREGGRIPARWRRLSIPNPVLAAIQREILHEIRSWWPGDPSTMVPSEVHGIGDRGPMLNAWTHRNADRLVRLDIEDFFGSVRRGRIAASLQALNACRIDAGTRMDAGALRLMARLCTYDGSLPQGACTSPLLANLCFLGVDMQLRRFATESSLTYTRYFDDLCFSTERTDIRPPDGLLRLVMPAVFNALGKSSFHINLCKTREGSGREFELTGFEIQRGRLRWSRRVRRWIKRLIDEADHHPASPLDAVIRLWKSERVVSRRGIGTRLGDDLERRRLVWYDLLGRIDAGLELAGVEGGDRDASRSAAREFASDLLADLERPESTTDEPRFHSNGVIVWAASEIDGSIGTIAIRDPRGRLTAILTADRSVCTGESLSGLLDHLQGLQAASVLDEDGELIGAVRDHQMIATLLDGLLTGTAPVGASPWAEENSMALKNDHDRRAAELATLDRLLRRLADADGVELPRMPDRRPAHTGEAFASWLTSLAACLRSIGCDRPVTAAATDAVSLWRSSIIVTIRAADWGQNERAGLYDWERLRETTRRGIRPERLKRAANLSESDVRYWQLRLCREVHSELLAWESARPTTSPSSRSVFGLERIVQSAARLLIRVGEHSELGWLDGNARLEEWIRERLPRLADSGGRRHWDAILETARELAMGIVESRGPRRHAGVEELGRRIVSSDGKWRDGAEDSIEKTLYRQMLRCGSGGDQVEVGTLVWHLRNLESHGAPPTRSDERSKRWKQVNRVVAMVGRRPPEDWREDRPSSVQLEESFQLKRLERFEILAAIISGIEGGLRDFDAAEYERTIRDWRPRERQVKPPPGRQLRSTGSGERMRHDDQHGTHSDGR